MMCSKTTEVKALPMIHHQVINSTPNGTHMK